MWYTETTMVVVVDNAAGMDDACEGCFIVFSFEFWVLVFSLSQISQILTDFYKKLIWNS